MTVISMVAKELQMSPKDLLKESLKTYLEKRLARVESDIFIIAKKYGVKDIFELDTKIKDGFLTEKEAYGDYFIFDNLGAERQKIKTFLEKF